MRPPPKNWAMTTVAPLLTPRKTDMNRNITGKAMPTAARAAEPTKLPTTQLSTIL